MKRAMYDVSFDGIDHSSVVWETSRQRDILDVLDEMLENAEIYGWDYIFSDVSFYIEYADGTTYEANGGGEYGVYKRRGIKRMIYENPYDTQVYGPYTVNEYGYVE